MKKYIKLLSENFQFLVMKFSIYLNRHVFIMFSYRFSAQSHQGLIFFHLLQYLMFLLEDGEGAYQSIRIRLVTFFFFFFCFFLNAQVFSCDGNTCILTISITIITHETINNNNYVLPSQRCHIYHYRTFTRKCVHFAYVILIDIAFKHISLLQST